jgi:hypothetical protein
LNQAITEHLYRSGYFQSAETFYKEGTIETDGITEDIKAKFKTLNLIVKEIREDRRVTSAIQWAKSHKEALEGIQSDLLFQLHYVEFVHLFKVQLDFLVALR